MTTVNDEDRFSTAIKIPDCDIKRENYLQQKIKFKEFSIVKGLKDALKRGRNPDMSASWHTYLSSDDDTNKS